MEIESKKINCPKCEQEVSLDEDLENIHCQKCENIFFYKKCLACSGYIFFDNNIYHDGYNIHCPYISCEAFFCLIKCENKECGKTISINGKYSQGDKIKCSYCKITFKKVKCPNKDCECQPCECGEDCECKPGDCKCPSLKEKKAPKPKAQKAKKAAPKKRTAKKKAKAPKKKTAPRRKTAKK